MQITFKGHRWLPYLLLSPSVIVVFIFFIIPSAESLFYSFYRLNITGTRKIFVGVNNFVRLFQDPEYIDSLVLTFFFTVSVVLLGLGISLAIATVANKRLRLFNLYRTLLIWPYALSPAIIGITFTYINNSTHAVIFITITAVWKMLGYNIIFFLAGLQGLPKETVEAGIIDGAGKWRIFWKITYPLISPTTFFLLVMNTLYSFFQLYRDCFISMNTGYASAQSIILLVFVSLLMLVQFKLAEKKVFYGT